MRKTMGLPFDERFGEPDFLVYTASAKYALWLYAANVTYVDHSRTEAHIKAAFEAIKAHSWAYALCTTTMLNVAHVGTRLIYTECVYSTIGAGSVLRACYKRPSF